MTKQKRSDIALLSLLIVGGIVLGLQMYFYILDEIAKAIVGAW